MLSVPKNLSIIIRASHIYSQSYLSHLCHQARPVAFTQLYQFVPSELLLFNLLRPYSPMSCIAFGIIAFVCHLIALQPPTP